MSATGWQTGLGQPEWLNSSQKTAQMPTEVDVLGTGKLVCMFLTAVPPVTQSRGNDYLPNRNSSATASWKGR